LLDDSGLNYLCQTAERFLAVSTVLNNMVIAQIENKPSARLLKHIIKCYNRLTENPRAQLALGQNMPEIVKERKKLVEYLDENSKKCLKNLCEVLSLDNQ
jgi:CCR4-NOT transcription complex subunit 9